MQPPIEPMLAKLVDSIPTTDGLLFEPKWDGFRSIVFRSADDVYIQSRDLKPLDRYFPELHDALLERLPPGCVVDGEIVIAQDGALNFDALQLRLHPAASRVEKLSKVMPSSFVGFDLLAVDGQSIMDRPQRERRDALEQLLADVKPPVYLTPMTRDHAVAAEWLQRFEGAGLDGVIAKPEQGTYQPGKRDDVQDQARANRGLRGLRLPLAQEGAGRGRLAAARLVRRPGDAASRRRHLVVHDGEAQAAGRGARAAAQRTRWHRIPGVNGPFAKTLSARQVGRGHRSGCRAGKSRWSAGKDLSWEPLRIERVCEVKYDHMQGDRFRHAATFLRWREDKAPADCGYDQLEVTPAYELAAVFGASRDTPRSAPE